MVRFTFPDPDHHLRSVRLYQEIRRPRDEPEFSFDADAGVWHAELPLPDADRIEYLIQLEHPDGGYETTCDPHNPIRSPGAFGDKSVIELPGYEPPSWVSREVAGSGETTPVEFKCRAVKGRLPGFIWAPSGTDPAQPLPLVIAHDGPEYAALTRVTDLFALAIGSGELPPFRAALIAPVDRDQIFSASAAYARSLAHEILPEVLRRAPVPTGRNMRIGMGASLGALAMLHAHRRSPATFGALFLQSGSYFRMRFDKQESGFVRFNRISRFVGEVLTANEWAHPIPVTMTCGTVEENLANNRAVADALASQGYEVELVVNRDGHNWVGWRDTFEPHLLDLMKRMWA